MDMPSYYKLHADLWRGVNDALPPVQAAKVLYALEALFFDGVEVDTEKLPKTARGIYATHRQLVLGYRMNALNGSKNKQTQKARSKACRKAGQEVSQKPTEKDDQLFTQEFDQEF